MWIMRGLPTIAGQAMYTLIHRGRYNAFALDAEAWEVNFSIFGDGNELTATEHQSLASVGKWHDGVEKLTGQAGRARLIRDFCGF